MKKGEAFLYALAAPTASNRLVNLGSSIMEDSNDVSIELRKQCDAIEASTDVHSNGKGSASSDLRG